MAVGGKHRSRRADAEAPAGRGEDGRTRAGAVDVLLPRVARGDDEAFASVCDQLAGAVYGLVSRIVGDQGQAEQVTAEVLAEVRRSASRFSPAQGSGLSWVMTLARRRAISHAGTAGAGDPAGPAGTAGAGAMPGRAAKSLLTHRGLASLPEPQREAVILASTGYSYQQAAVLTGVSAGTAAERLRDGLLRLSSLAA
jgi:RNA polymerase sigma-70 factor, ECF subfamily